MNKRLSYMDALRGVGMLMVVYHHLIVMGMRDAGYNSPVNAVIRPIFMPLFFFISGYFSARLLQVDNSQIKNVVISKVQGLLIPTVVMFSFCLIYFRLNPYEFLVDSFKCGYWFTWVLFVITLIFLFVSVFLPSRIKVGGQIMIGIILYFLGKRMNEGNVLVASLSLDFVCLYYIYYIMGIIVRVKEPLINGFLKNKWFLTVMFLLSVLPFFVSVVGIKRDVLSCLQIFVLFVIFKFYAPYFDRNDGFGRCLQKIGKHSLEVYFLHYYLLFKIDFLCRWLSQLTSDYCFRSHSCIFVVEIVLVGVIAMAICYLCMMIKKILAVFPVITKLCFGR